ncbi:hypothetical protein FRC03_002070, partial [Tulasnella sp. 419]
MSTQPVDRSDKSKRQRSYPSSTQSYSQYLADQTVKRPRFALSNSGSEIHDALSSGGLIGVFSEVENLLVGTPFSQLKAAFAEVDAIVQTMSMEERHSQELSSLMNKLIISIIQPIKDQRITRGTETTVDALTSDLTQIISEQRETVSNSRLYSSIIASNSEIFVNNLCGALDHALQNYMETSAVTEPEIIIEEVHQLAKATNLDTEALLDEARENRGRSIMIQQSIAGTETMLLTQAQQELLNKLPHANARYDSASRTDAPSCLENTRVTLLAEIFEWIRDPDNKQKIFWLHGLAGTGKSTIAHTVAKAIDEDDRLGASFFFSRDEADLRNPLLVIPTIALQLAEHLPEFKSCLAKSLEMRKDAGTASLSVQMKKLMIEPIREVERRLSSSIIVVVMDALDECENPQLVGSLMKLLLEFLLGHHTLKVKFFITSRPEHHISSVFKNPRTNEVSHPYILHNIETSIVQADIEVFLRHGLTKVADDFDLSTIANPWPSDNDVTNLVERSGALFIVASTAVKFIADPYIGQPNEQLRALLTNERVTGTSPYDDLDQVYYHVVRTSVGKFKKVDDFVCVRFRDVVGAIITVLDPLPASTLRSLLGCEIDYVSGALRLLHSVIVIPSDVASGTEPLRVFHLSFPNFLTERCEDARFAINPVLHHSYLAFRCLSILNDFLRRNILDLPDPLVLNEEVSDLKDRLSKVVLPHHQYACRSWGLHLHAALAALNEAGSSAHSVDHNSLEEINTKILSMLSNFCNSKLLEWFEVLSVLKCLDMGKPVLKAANEWLH